MGTNSFGNTQYRFATRRQGDFVGTDSRDVNTRILGGLTGTSGGSYNSTGSTSSPYGTAQSARQAGSSSYRRSSAANRYGTSANSGQILVGLDATFDRDLPSDPQVSSAVKQRLVAAMRLPAAAPVEVLVQGNTAVLRGAVATPHDRALAERLVLLEPGIGHVMNELQVERSGATLGRPQPSPAGQFRPSR
jgi:osmotically-inducible protein OsmY